MSFTDAGWLQKAVAATGNGTPVEINGLATLMLEVVISASATVTFEAAGPLTAVDGTASASGGAGYVAIPAVNIGTNAVGTTATASGLYRVDVRGFNYLRARVSTFGSGTVSVYGFMVDAGGGLALAPAGTTPALAAGENHLGEIGGRTIIAAATQFTRPADTTAYASGDLVANSTTAGSVTPLQFTVARVAAGSGMIRRVRLKKSGTSVTNTSFRLHLYGSSPTAANGDNGAWSTSQAATYAGSLDVTLDKAFTDGAAGNGTPSIGSEINFALASGQVVYGLLEARAAYTPTSGETFDLSLEVIQN